MADSSNKLARAGNRLVLDRSKLASQVKGDPYEGYEIAVVCRCARIGDVWPHRNCTASAFGGRRVL